MGGVAGGSCTACVVVVIFALLKQKKKEVWLKTATVTAIKPWKAETEHVSGVLLPAWKSLVLSGKPRSLTVRCDFCDT